MAHKPHAICVPFPAQGHINPMLQVAKLLHSKGFHITFVNTEYIHNRILRSNPTSLCDFLNFRFETISNGLDPLDHEANLDVTTVCCALSNNCLAPFLNLIQKLNDGVASEVPPVTCIVSDGGMSFTIDAAQQLGIPDVLFWTSSGCGVLGYTHYPHLVEKGLAPLKDASYLTNGYLETTVDWIPGMKTIRLKDLPTFFRTTDPNDLYFNWILREVDRASRASAIIMNTYDSLEEDALNSLCKMYACSEWGIGIEIDKNFKREEIEKVIIELMEGEKGKEMKKKATEWKRKAQEATSYGGSSYDNLDKVLEILLGNNKMDN
ncbi:hypothetical protein JCGZ_24912 [Jatropha curcas]|uniref:Glycosyltransferase N-terminal domain-containing protein n=1 Tax=Jatropha curcas TaxID=180498 RepID=A0A067L101_JATCU|nr:hypothetical protein JCGZ_24912 [Jatropha curcas]